MVAETIIRQIRNDFKFLENETKIIGVLLYESHVSEDNTTRSDIDICIIAPNQNLYLLYKFIIKN
ncbi:MAG: nucleotidyltransferase domain-containing protein [Promethearchaeota archaeon]